MSYVFRLMSSRLAFRVPRPFAALVLAIACALPASAVTTVTSWSGLKETLRSGVSVALGANVSQDSDAVALDGNQVVTLDLNGYTLTRHKNYRLFCLNSSTCELTICDTSASGSGKVVGNDKLTAEGGLVLVEKGHLIVNGGEITGKVSAGSGMGGFACVKTDGRITVNGGTIKSCEGGRGGAFYMSGGTLTINGGTISGCTTPEYGGAVYAYPSDSCTISITMNGGKITGCNATNAGGGFHCAKTTLAINGGTVTGCKSNYGGAYSLSTGSTLTMNGGVVTKCSATSQGPVFNNSESTIKVNGGVFDDSNVTGQGAKLGNGWTYSRVGSSSLYAVSRDLGVRDGFVNTGTFAFDPSGKEYADAGFVLSEGVRIFHDAAGTYTLNGICVSSWSELTSALSGGTNAVLSKDILQEGGEMTLSGAQVAALDLRGHVLTASAGNRIFRLNSSDCELAISDSSAAQTGTITRSDTLNADGGLAFVENGHLVLEGGTVIGKTSERGGVAFVNSNACVTISGGTITNCTATEGAVLYVAGGTAEMTGGTVSKCEAASNGGAIRAYNGSVKLFGGTISGCRAIWGGAVYVFSADLTMTGTTIQDCSASSKGGALYVDRGISPTVSGGLILKSAAGGTVYGKNCTVMLTGGIFDDSTVTGGTGVGIGSGFALAGFGSAGKYVIGRGVVFSCDGNLGGGTFSFDPAEQRYKEAGLKLAYPCSSCPNGDGTYTVAAAKEIVSVSNWSQLKESLLLGASVRLAADVAQDGNTAYLDDSQVARIDLNGHTLTRHKDYRLFCLRSTGCRLTIDDASATGTGKVTCTDKLSADGGLLMVEQGHLVLENGTVTGKTAGKGGFAYVKSGGSVTVNGGTVSSCTAGNSGGVFYVDGGTVTVNGGVFHATPNMGFYREGGSMVVRGGVMDRTLHDGNWHSGVTFENAEYSFTGSDAATHYVIGRDVAFTGDNKLRAGTFTFDPREAVYEDAGLLIPEYATVTPNDDATYTVSVSDPVQAKTWEVLRECLELGLNVSLAADVEASGATGELKAECANKNLVLDLNGHVITHTATGDRFLTLFPEAANCVLTIRDSSEAKTGAIVHTGETMTANGGCVYVDAGTEVVLKGGLISGFATTGEGGAVYVNAGGGTFTFAGGVISNCTASAVVNHGTTRLAGGVTDDATLTNAANNVTFETGCSFVGTGRGMYVIGRVPMFSNGQLLAGTFCFDPSEPLYAASGLVLADFTRSVGRRDGTWKVVRRSDEDTLVRNGSFERGTALPLEDGVCPLAESGVVAWTGGDGATVYGCDSGWKGFSVLDGDYSLALAPGAAITQQVAVVREGLYTLSVGYAGEAGAVLSVGLSNSRERQQPVTGTGWRQMRYDIGMNYAGVFTLVVSNASPAEAALAVDSIALTYAGPNTSLAEDVRVVNGGFEIGTALPAADGASDLASADVSGWVGTAGAGIYGAAATNDYPCGVAEGQYALYLESKASVSQSVWCAESAFTNALVVNGVTGSYYAVDYSFAAQQQGDQPLLIAQLVTPDGTVREIARSMPLADGSWSACSTLVFLPVGTNWLALVNDSNTGRVVVDNVTCRRYVHPLADVILNGGFEYGAALPDVTGYDYAAPRGRVEPSAWSVTNAAGVYGASAIRMSRAGTFFGRYGLFLQDGGRAEQDFLVPTVGTYRIAFAIAERLAATGNGHPAVTVTLDGEELGTYTAYSSRRFETQVAFRELAVGQHRISFEASAILEQALLLDAVSIRIRPEVTPIEDITGVTPVVHIKPEASTQTLLARGAELTYAEIDPDEFVAEDFAQDEENDYFRLEAHEGVYAHPEYVLQTPLQILDGFAFSVGGLPRGGDGPILSYELAAEALSDASAVFAFESRDAGNALAFVRYPIENGVRRAGEDVFTTTISNFVRLGVTDLLVNWKDGAFGFYVNGHAVGTVPFSQGSTFLLKRLRLGAYPDSTETASVADRRCAAFDLSDVRVYPQGLSSEQIVALSENVRGSSIDVTLYDAASASSFGTYPRRVGGVYGPLAAYQASQPGRVFLGWKLAADGSGDFVAADTVVTALEDHRLYAQWSNLVYRVTYDFNGYPFAENRTQEILAGEAYNLPTGFEVKGATFHDWTNRYGQVVSAGAVFPTSGNYADETLYCSYENAYGTITFEPHNGQAAIAVDGVKVGTGVLDAAPDDPVRAGYGFVGWFNAETGGAQATDETLFGSVDGETWNAHWLGDEQTVTWRAEDGSVPAQTTVSRSGEPYVLPDPVVCTNAARDVRFYGWGREVGGSLEVIAVWDYAAGCWSTNAAVTTWTNAHDAVALWRTACAFDANGGTVAEEKTYLYPGEAYGTWMPLPTPARTGYTFDGWSTNATAGAFVTDAMTVEDPAPASLVACWHALTVKVTLDANGGTSTVESVLVSYDGPYGTLPTPTRPGYALDSWHYILEDGALVTPETIVSNPDDHTVVASWTNAWYTMTYRINGIDGASFSQRYENPWQALYVPTQAELGEHGVFKGWMLAETGEVIAEGEPATMTRDGALIALIAGESCTITLDAVDGVLDADRRTLELEYQSEVKGLPEPPDVWRPNCTFLGWYTQEGLHVTNGTLWVFGGTTPLQAKWRGTTAHTVTYERNMTPYDSPETYKELCYGDAMPTVAPPERADGAAFLGWFFGETPCTDARGNPLVGYERCPWEVDVTLVARWSMPRDFFAQAAALEDGVTNTVVGVDATDELDEPCHDAEGTLRATHWYAFNATAGTPVRIVFEDLTSLEPCVQLAVYSGTNLTELVKKASLLELDGAEAVLEWTPKTTGSYYLALAQDAAPDQAALTAYRIAATGVSSPVWRSAWTDPATMPGETPEVRVYNALRSDGFSDTVATRLSSPTNAYVDFCAWAQVGKQGSEVSPDLLCDQTNVILAAAYGLTSAPEASVEIVSCESASTNGVSGLRATLRVTGACTVGGVKSELLLKAALGLEGSSDVSGPYSAASVDCTTESCDAARNETTVLVTPAQTGETAQDAFFFKGVTY